MTTENPKPTDSKLLFLEKATWKKGREVITVLLPDDHGKKRRVGHIYLDYVDNKKVFLSMDAKGQEQFPPAENLYELKKQYKGIEQELALSLREAKLRIVRDDDEKEKEIER